MTSIHQGAAIAGVAGSVRADPDVDCDDRGRPRIEVFALSPRETVAAVGGWLFDRVTAGWEVDVFTAAPIDERPFRILGARTLAVDSVASIPSMQRTRVVAMGAVATGSDMRITSRAVGARRHDAQVVIWGDSWPSYMGRSRVTTDYEMSDAAMAFKRHALVAAGVSDARVARHEAFMCSGRRPLR